MIDSYFVEENSIVNSLFGISAVFTKFVITVRAYYHTVFDCFSSIRVTWNSIPSVILTFKKYIGIDMIGTQSTNCIAIPSTLLIDSNQLNTRGEFHISPLLFLWARHDKVWELIVNNDKEQIPFMLIAGHNDKFTGVIVSASDSSNKIAESNTLKESKPLAESYYKEWLKVNRNLITT